MSLSRIAAQIREKSRRNVEYKAKLERIERRNEALWNYINRIEEKTQKAKRKLVIQKINYFSVCSFNEVIRTIHVQTAVELKKEAEIKREKTAKKLAAVLEKFDEITASVTQDRDDTVHPVVTQRDEQFEVKKITTMEESESLTEDIKQLTVKLEKAQQFYDVRLKYHESLERHQARVTKQNQARALSAVSPAQKKPRQRSEQVGQAGDDKAANRISGTDFVPASTMLVNRSRRPNNERPH